MGKPVSEGMHGFPLPRVPDTRVLPAEYDTSIAYNDFFLYLLQHILYNMGQPMLHRLPPKQNGTVPDFLLYFAGDDDACDKQVTLDAYRVMEQYGLPYHVNLMPAPPDGTGFTLPKEEYDRLKSIGGEFSLHFDFVDAYGGPMTPENFKKQFELYKKTYGDAPVSPVAHCLVTSGWTERYRYMADLGIKSDHFHGGEVDRDDPENINAFNLYGFTFGTAFPSFVFDDAEHYNKRIEFLNLPGAYYEPRLRGAEDEKTLQKIHRMVDDAAFFGRPAVMFMHPHYLSGHFEKTEVVFGAVQEALRYGEQQGYTVDFTTPDRLTLWWLARSRSTIEKLAQNRYRVEVNAEDGIVVKLPMQPGKQVMVNGAPAAAEEKTVDGLKWLMVPLTKKGQYELAVQ